MTQIWSFSIHQVCLLIWAQQRPGDLSLLYAGKQRSILQCTQPIFLSSYVHRKYTPSALPWADEPLPTALLESNLSLSLHKTLETVLFPGKRCISGTIHLLLSTMFILFIRNDRACNNQNLAVSLTHRNWSSTVQCCLQRLKLSDQNCIHESQFILSVNTEKSFVWTGWVWPIIFFTSRSLSGVFVYIFQEYKTSNTNMEIIISILNCHFGKWHPIFSNK